MWQLLVELLQIELFDFLKIKAHVDALKVKDFIVRISFIGEDFIVFCDHHEFQVELVIRVEGIDDSVIFLQPDDHIKLIVDFEAHREVLEET